MTHPLVVENLSVRHDGATAARPAEVSFSVASGEVVLLMGPSGCGKSTLALAMAGLIPGSVPAEITGRVLVAGIDTTSVHPGALSEYVGMVFQDPEAQIVTATLLDEVCFGAENLLVPVAEVLARAEDALRLVGLWERRNESPDVLSGGGKQRLAIACALALDPAVMILDEPTANLDPSGIDDVYRALQKVVAQGTRSIVLIEHTLDAAVDLVDRVLVLDRDGRLIMDGPAQAILRERADELLDLGVWLPAATLAAIHFRQAGVAITPLPLTSGELASALDATRALPIRITDPPSRTPGARHPLVRVTQLDAAHGRTRVLHGVDVDVNAGDFLAIMGPNGAGKTTLLQAIAGVVAPPKRRVHIGTLDVGSADVRTLTSTIGFVFQNPEHQFIRASVTDELAFGLRNSPLSDSERAQKIDDLLDRFGLANHRNAHPFLLSGGQKRRLSVATALLSGASVLALDEPTFGQDREHAAEILALLAELNAAGITILVVTHDLQLVADNASHVAVMSGGRILRHDTVDAVFADEDLLHAASLRRPPFAQAMGALRRHPEWRSAMRIGDIAMART